MRRFFFRWLASLLVFTTCGLPDALAQRADAPSRGIRRDDETGPGIDTSQKTAALPYAVAGMILILVMVIVCTPSRKILKEEDE